MAQWAGMKGSSVHAASTPKYFVNTRGIEFSRDGKVDANLEMRTYALKFYVLVVVWLNCTILLTLGGSNGPSSVLSRKRLLSEFQEIKSLGLSLEKPFNQSKSECGIRLSPLKKSLHEWHFSFLGPDDSAFSGGCYHGRILLPPDYPRKAPQLCMLTPSGRWEVGKDICLSVTSYHQETWNPNWGLRTLVLGLKLHMPSQAQEVGGISASFIERMQLAKRSRLAVCPHCGCRHDALLSSSTVICAAEEECIKTTSNNNDYSENKTDGRKKSLFRSLKSLIWGSN